MATERLALILETLGADKAVGEVKKVTGAVGGVAKSAGVGTSGLRSLSVAGTSLGDVMGNKVVAGVVGAGAAIATFAAGSAKQFVDATASVRAFQRTSGATAEEASRLVFAMEHLGVPVEDASRAMFMLGKNVEVNGKKLAGFGVTIAKNADGNTDLAGTLLNVVDAYNKTGDQATRNALVQAAFGRSGQALLPILAKDREGIAALFDEADRTGHVFSQDDLNTGKEFGIALKELKADLEQVGLAVGRVVVPAFTDLIGILDQAVNGAKGLVGWFSHIPGVDKVFEGVSIWGHAAGEAIDWLAGNDDKQASSASNNADANRDAAGALDERSAAADQFEQATFKVVDADDAVAKASSVAGRAEREYQELLRKGAVDTEKVADARRSLESATRSLGHAQREQKQAQEDYNDALAAFNLLPSDTNADKLADAKDRLSDADDNLADATSRQTDAQGELAKAQAGDPEFQDKLADAKQRVADTTKDLSDKTYAAVKAHQAEKDAVAAQADEAQRLLDTLKQLEAQNPALTAALDPAIKLLNALTGAGPSIIGWQPLPAGIAGPPTPILGAGPAAPINPVVTSVVPNDFVGPLAPGQARAPRQVTINQTFNTQVDPSILTRQMVWALN